MTKLKDIADKIGVSVMTVSRALNSPDLVKSELREKIIAASKELNYVPHHGARSLASNKTGIIKIITGLETTTMYFMLLLTGISEYLSEKGYAIIIEKNYQTSYRCDGIIVMSLNTEESEDFFSNTDTPCVLFGKTSQNMIDYVDIDNELGISITTNHIIKLNHRRIAFIGIKSNEPYSYERLNSFRKTMKANSLPVPDEHIIICENNFEDSKLAAETLLKRSGFTAVICSSDLQAMSMLNAANAHGIKIPEDLSITGFDGIDLNLLTIPKLTTVSQPVYKIGRKLSETLIDRINEPAKKREKILFNPEFIPGESTAICEV